MMNLEYNSKGSNENIPFSKQDNEFEDKAEADEAENYSSQGGQKQPS